MRKREGRHRGRHSPGVRAEDVTATPRVRTRESRRPSRRGRRRSSSCVSSQGRCRRGFRRRRAHPRVDARAGERSSEWRHRFGQTRSVDRDEGERGRENEKS
jgi:hypothetical protein